MSGVTGPNMPQNCSTNTLRFIPLCMFGVTGLNMLQNGTELNDSSEHAHPRVAQFHTSYTGESTPTAFAAFSNPTDEDPRWPLMLEQIFKRLFPAVQERLICTHITPSLPSTTTE